MTIECPSCGTPLEYDDTYGRRLGRPDSEVLGYIYRCPKGREESEECESSVFHVAGSYYTDKAGNLHEGYPC